MAGTPLSRDLYDAMVAAFREFPGNYSAAARALGVDRRMTSRGWNVGWPRYDWARPIKQVLADEREHSQARMREMREAAAAEATAKRDEAREAAVAAQAEEERILDVARKDVLGALVMAAELTPAMRTLGQLVSKALMEGKLAEALGPKRALDLITRHANLVSKAVHAADAVVKLSRLDRGEPNAHVGLTAGGVPQEHLTYEEAVAELESAADLLEIVRKSGELPADVALAFESAGGVGASGGNGGSARPVLPSPTVVDVSGESLADSDDSNGERE